MTELPLEDAGQLTNPGRSVRAVFSLSLTRAAEPMQFTHVTTGQGQLLVVYCPPE